MNGTFTPLPVTDLNKTPIWGADSNLHRYKFFQGSNIGINVQWSIHSKSDIHITK